MFFSYDALTFNYQPFPVGLAKPIMSEETYREFVNRFPPLELFTSHSKAGRQGDKYTLSQKVNPRGYRQFIRSDSVWREFHQWIKSDEFVFGLLEALAERDVDLGYRRMTRGRRFAEKLFQRARGKVPGELARLKARFEFSALSAAGGHLRPHTDAPGKIVTLVIPILGEEGWDSAIGGATDINVPMLDRHRFNLVNHKANFDEMKVVDSLDYAANQALIFVRTHNSWHSVRPMTGTDPNALRRTLTINIEIMG